MIPCYDYHMHGRVYKFTGILKMVGNMPPYNSLPIYDDNLYLVGAFTALDENRVCGFLAGNGYPLALNVTLGDSFFFTALEDTAGKISSAIVSDKSLNQNSIIIKTAEDQLHD